LKCMGVESESRTLFGISIWFDGCLVKSKSGFGLMILMNELLIFII
jgi:hypothetical protein